MKLDKQRDKRSYKMLTINLHIEGILNTKSDTFPPHTVHFLNDFLSFQAVYWFPLRNQLTETWHLCRAIYHSEDLSPLLCVFVFKSLSLDNAAQVKALYDGMFKDTHWHVWLKYKQKNKQWCKMNLAVTIFVAVFLLAYCCLYCIYEPSWFTTFLIHFLNWNVKMFYLRLI